MKPTPTHLTTAKSPDLIPLGDGLNFSTPLEQISGTVVPSPLFFVRSNNPPPTIAPEQWSLRIDGRVRNPFTLRLDALQQLPKHTQEVWLECAGNGRARWDPPTEGNQWDEFAVSNAVFAGASLSEVLNLAEIEAGAIEVVATGGDADSFQRGLPLDVAFQPEVLLAWEMNGQPIPEVNGGPVRLIVPRWAGIASVKWPVHLEVVDRPFQGYFNAERYIFVDGNGQTQRTVRELPVKSVIAAPADAAVLRGGAHTVFGFAWSGHGTIARVDVSTDDGQTWTAARLTPGQGPWAWARWELEWTPSTAGAIRIASRATDSAGNVQPAEAVWNKFGYEMNAIATREVVVDA